MLTDAKVDKRRAPPSLQVRNYYRDIGSSGPGYRNPCKYMPQHPFRALLVGSTGSGKTNLAMNLIDKCSNFDRVYLFAKSLDEPLYALLAERENVKASNTLDDLPELDELQAEQTPPPADAEPGEEETEPEAEPGPKPQLLFIFDDMITASKKENALITDYFIRSRKCNCSCVYISQSYFSIPKDLRLQAGYVFLKDINSTRTLSQIIKDYAIDITGPELEKLYRDAMKHGDFLQLDMTTRLPRMKYRRGFGLCYITK